MAGADEAAGEITLDVAKYHMIRQSLSLASLLAWDLWEPLPSPPSLPPLPSSPRRSAKVVGRAGGSLEGEEVQVEEVREGEVGEDEVAEEEVEEDEVAEEVEDVGEEEHLEESTVQVEEGGGSFRYILRSIVE